MNRPITLGVVGAALLMLTGCGSETESASEVAETNVPLSTEHAGSEFCTTFAAFDSSTVFLHAGEDTIRPGLTLQIEQIEELRSTLPPELADSEQALDIRLVLVRATLDIYAANGFDADAVSADPAYSDVSDAIGASLQADVVNETRNTREYCGIEL